MAAPKVALVLGGDPGDEEKMPSSKPSGKDDAKAVRVDALRAFGEAMKEDRYEEADDLWREYQAACEEV